MQEHHAYLYEGRMALLEALAQDATELFGFSQEHDPDVYVREYTQFGIEESRALTQQALLRTVSGRGLFVLGVSAITSEAQQALLKLFEEPQVGVIFVLLVPQGTLFPTLRSRFIAYPQQFLGAAPSSLQASAFLGMTYTQRSSWIAELLEDETHARELVRAFFEELETVLYGALTKASDERKAVLVRGLADIATFRTYLSDRSPSLKMLLEHMAVTLPTFGV